MPSHQMPLRLRKYIGKTIQTKTNKSKIIKHSQLLPNRITFIIPTIGRPTLRNTVDSIKHQTIKDHNTIIVFDGIRPTLSDIKDDRFKIIQIQKKGWNNCAANVRHEGIRLVKTKWIAFVDDDDTISETYIEKFLGELQIHPDVDVVIFRMIGHERDNYNIIPNLETHMIEYGNVGISFVMKKNIYDLYHFEASSMEDFSMLNKLQQNGHRIIISPHITYFVKGNQTGKDQVGNRLLINF